jgi:hypothetical protein
VAAKKTARPKKPAVKYEEDDLEEDDDASAEKNGTSDVKDEDEEEDEDGDDDEDLDEEVYDPCRALESTRRLLTPASDTWWRRSSRT